MVADIPSGLVDEGVGRRALEFTRSTHRTSGKRSAQVMRIEKLFSAEEESILGQFPDAIRPK